MNNNKKTKLQFTKLTPDDIATYEDIYINMLVGLAPLATNVSLSVASRIYYEYAIKEVQKANDLFQNTFG